MRIYCVKTNVPPSEYKIHEAYITIIIQQFTLSIVKFVCITFSTYKSFGFIEKFYTHSCKRLVTNTRTKMNNKILHTNYTLLTNKILRNKHDHHHLNNHQYQQNSNR